MANQHPVAETLAQWRNGLRIKHICHARAAARAHRLHRLLGGPSIALATASGTSGLSTLIESAGSWLSVVAGCTGISAAALMSIQTFLDYQGLASANAAASAQYGDLRRIVDELLLRDPDDQKVVAAMPEVRERWVELETAAPAVSQKLVDDVNQKVLNAPSRTS